MSLSRQERESFAARRAEVADAILEMLCSATVQKHVAHYSFIEMLGADRAVEDTVRRLPVATDTDGLREMLISLVLLASRRLIELG
jgi:hypothetical protein